MCTTPDYKICMQYSKYIKEDYTTQIKVLPLSINNLIWFNLDIDRVISNNERSNMNIKNLENYILIVH
jgi:hypothetical protein